MENIKWTKEEMKQYFLFNHIYKTILSGKDKNNNTLELEMEVDAFNGHTYYNITDGMSITYNIYDAIEDAIDKYYELKG